MSMLSNTNITAVITAGYRITLGVSAIEEMRLKIPDYEEITGKR